MKQITVTAKRVKDNNSANGGNTDKLAIRFQEGRAAEGDGPVNGLPKVDRGESVQSRTGAKRRKSGSVKRFKQDPASSGPNLTQNATNVHVGYAITDAEMEIVNLGLAADSSSHSQHSRCVSNLLGNQKEDEGQLILSRNSYIVLGAIQVTPDVDGGVAFLINDNSSLLDNSQGWWLGMVNANTNGSSQASVAVEFDTRKSDEQDMEGNHIGLNINRIQSAKQVSLSNYDVYISAGGQDLRKIFMGFFGSTSNEAELNCVKSWAFSDTDIGGNGKQLWVWIMVPVASLGILVGVAICLCLRRVYKEERFSGSRCSTSREHRT
ncbi:hypothetical protein GOBAR_AA35552 [Gossypium barbadense]|uniref:Legume lectin domain-containing protein n=1 Tax=Gossypium barbadense TaxID=3634 RepID=A0A2P5W222_GOSBA|nr:hypothetical protein GOBAR_AA35552 [Gossypium barbadense]